MEAERSSPPLEQAIRELIEIRHNRLVSLGCQPLDLAADLEDLEQELLSLLVSPERMAANDAWSALLDAAGTASEVWASYPSAAGLVRLLRTPGAREIVVALGTRPST